MGGGDYHYEINVFLKYTLDTIIVIPRNYKESKISLKYIPINIHNFEHFGDYEYPFRPSGQ